MHHLEIIFIDFIEQKNWTVVIEYPSFHSKKSHLGIEIWQPKSYNQLSHNIHETKA